MEKIKEICMPVVDYLSEITNPYVKVIISTEGIAVVSTECFIPVKKATNQED